MNTAPDSNYQNQANQGCKPKQANGPRITDRDVNAAIIGEDYHHFPDSTLTVCMLRLRNGFTVLGQSACVSRDNFDPELGREIARRNACEEVWKVLGYGLCEQIHQTEIKKSRVRQSLALYLAVL
ncbi:Gp49 family protein [Chitinimonas sp. PSY-7]|uniref:Gp49 family protein n=1 Tax=Chitinimonas sp. PSY-7 TaxID=3459088 RepID=UPI00404024D0